MYEKIYELENGDTATPVSTDPSVPSGEVVTDGADLDRQDSTLSADELALVRAKFFRLVHGASVFPQHRMRSRMRSF